MYLYSQRASGEFYGCSLRTRWKHTNEMRNPLIVVHRLITPIDQLGPRRIPKVSKGSIKGTLFGNCAETYTCFRFIMWVGLSILLFFLICTFQQSPSLPQSSKQYLRSRRSKKNSLTSGKNLGRPMRCTTETTEFQKALKGHAVVIPTSWSLNCSYENQSVDYLIWVWIPGSPDDNKPNESFL